MTERGWSVCAVCGADLNDATCLSSTAAPAAGDVSVCLYCGNVAVFTGDGVALRQATAAELGELLAEPEVRRVVDLVKTRAATGPPV